MSQTLVPNGIAVNFGFKSTSSDYGITDSGTVLKGFLLQNTDYETGADVESVRVLQGDIVSRNWYDLHKKCSLVFVIAGTGIAASITSTSISPFTPGTIISITACASHPELVATTWEMQSGAKITGDTTKSAMLTIPMEIRPGITAAQSA
jgi:hypothetical protein